MTTPTAPERPGPERPGPEYPPEWDAEPDEPEPALLRVDPFAFAAQFADRTEPPDDPDDAWPGHWGPITPHPDDPEPLDCLICGATGPCPHIDEVDEQ